MRIKSIKVNHFRALNDFSIDLEKDLSVIIGKNNTGKSSVLAVLDKFLGEGKTSFRYHDFNKDYLESQMPFPDNKQSPPIKIEENGYKDIIISMEIIIEYDDEDYIGNLSKFFMSLSPESKEVKLRFEYIMDYGRYNNVIQDYIKYRKQENKNPKTLKEYFIKNINKYFIVVIKTLKLDDSECTIIQNKKDVNSVINFKYIQAVRDVNDSNQKMQTLSKLAQKYYDTRKNRDIDDTILDDTLRKIDETLEENYKEIFKDVINDIDKFTDINRETKISIRSVLEGGILLKEASQVAYDKSKDYLPEEYNGLGYLNLFAMIFNINIQIDEFRKVGNEKNKPSDINLLYIEEPEVHTHPQMQYVFIKNIMKKLEEGKEGKEGENKIELQMILSSHSAHIVSQSDFDKIKYFYVKEDNVYSKNLCDLKTKMKRRDDPDENRFKFLKRYLTIDRAEIFFCDKAILVEGDTERILINAMMKKIDNTNIGTEGYVPLLSQNISVIEVGAYSHIFDELIEFLDINTLIITDIDAVDTPNGSACKVDDGKHTSNASIKYYINKSFDQLKTLTLDDKKLSKVNGNWMAKKEGKVMIAYQTRENNYYARSFEDAFISLNYEFIKNNKDDFQGLKNRSYITGDDENKYYEIARDCIDSKGIFATDIIYYSDDNFTNWSIPKYIKDGLTWLQK